MKTNVIKKNICSIKDTSRKEKRSMMNDRRKWTEGMIIEAESGQKGHMKTRYEITRMLSNDSKSKTTAGGDKDSKILS